MALGLAKQSADLPTGGVDQSSRSSTVTPERVEEIQLPPPSPVVEAPAKRPEIEVQKLADHRLSDSIMKSQARFTGSRDIPITDTNQRKSTVSNKENLSPTNLEDVIPMILPTANELSWKV